MHSENVGQDYQEEQIIEDKIFTDLGECYQRKNMRSKFISEYKLIINQNPEIFFTLCFIYIYVNYLE